MPGIKEKLEARPREMGRERSVGIHEIRNPLRRQNRASFHQRQMEPHFERRMILWPVLLHPGKLRSHHEACGCQDSLQMGFFDRFIDRQSQTEIISGDYDFFQCAFRAAEL